MIDSNNLTFGLDTFGDIAYDEQTGERWNYTQSLRNIVEEGKLADQVGVDVFALGEHHRAEYVIFESRYSPSCLSNRDGKYYVRDWCDNIEFG